MSKKAYSIEIPHFYSMVYREGNRTLTVEIDLRDTVPCLYLRQLNSWDPPGYGEAIVEADRDTIAERICDYLVNERGFRNVEVDRS